MNTRLVVCLALVAMAIPAFANEGKGASISVSGSLNVQKDLSVQAPAATPNPSAPAVEAKQDVTISAPVIDVNIKKVPVVTVSEAPCQKVCAPKCSISLERTCNKVQVPQKKCETVTTPVTKRMCHKKCTATVTTPAIEQPAAPSHPNPSAPAAGADASLSVSAGVEAKASVQAGHAGASADINKSLSVSVGKGSRKLQGLLPVKAMVAKAMLGDKVKCEDVCEDVASTQSEIKCTTENTEVEKCGFTPKQTCQEQCVCIPMKSVSVNLPSKPVSVSLDSSMGKGH